MATASRSSRGGPGASGHHAILRRHEPNPPRVRTPEPPNRSPPLEHRRRHSAQNHCLAVQQFIGRRVGGPIIEIQASLIPVFPCSQRPRLLRAPSNWGLGLTPSETPARTTFSEANARGSGLLRCTAFRSDSVPAAGFTTVTNHMRIRRPRGRRPIRCWIGRGRDASDGRTKT